MPCTIHNLMSVFLRAKQTGRDPENCIRTSLNNLRGFGSTPASSLCAQVQSQSRDHILSQREAGQPASAGFIVAFEVDLTIHHWEHFEFSFCPGNNIKQSCFRKSKPRVVNGSMSCLGVPGFRSFQTILPSEAEFSSGHRASGNSCMSSSWPRPIFFKLREARIQRSHRSMSFHFE